MWSAFDRAVLSVSSVEAASRTYASLLGRGPSWQGREAGQGRAEFVLANGAIEVRGPIEADPRPDALDPSRGTEGPIALCLACPDLDRTAEALARRGVGVQRVEEAFRDPSSGHTRRIRELRLDLAATRGVVISAREAGAGPPPGAGPAPSSEAEAGAPAGVGAEPDPAAVQGIDHVVVRTQDPEAAIELYRDRLGLRLALDREFPERGVRLVFFRLAGVTLELAARAKGTPGSDPDRLWGVAYRVTRPRAAHARLVAAGFEVSAVRPGNKPGTAVCTVRGPTHGVPTLIIGPEEE